MSQNETHKTSGKGKVWLVAGLILIIAAAGGMLVWKLKQSGVAGRPVPVPRSITFDGDVKADAQLAEGQNIKIPVEQLQRAGIKIDVVGESLAAASEGASANGVVEANSYREVPVKTLAGGVVRAVTVELGDSVARDQTIAVVFSNEFAAKQARYLALSTEVENARRNLDRRRRLLSINHPARNEFDMAMRSAKTADAVLIEARKRFDRTTKLVGIGAASREELEQDTTKLKTAEAEAEEAQKRLSRTERLLTVSQETRTDLEEAANLLQTAESERMNVRQNLLLFGMSPARVDSLRSVSQISSELAIRAPAAGTVTGRTANINEVVDANAEIVRITDLSEIWVVAEVFENQLSRLTTGTGASILSEALPNRLLRGRVAYIDPKLDDSTRTAKVRVELPNPEQRLKIGMYVRVSFGVNGDAEQTVPVIPANAAQSFGDGTVVFVETAEKGSFEVRQVRLGAESNGSRTVLEGLRVGERIVTDGSFMLRAELQKSGK